MEHECAWYIQIQGKHPQTNEAINRWGCAVTWLPVLQIETSQESRQTAAAVESFRNETIKQNGQLAVMFAEAKRLKDASRDS